jgi:PAS domain S-box-containing protein
MPHEDHNANDLFRELFEQAPLPYQSLDAEGRLLTVNQAWLETFGHERDEVIGHGFRDLLTDECAGEFDERFAQFKETGETHGTELELRRKDGRVVRIAANGNISYDEQGNVERTHCILIDITERTRTEEALRGSEEMFRQIAERSIDVIFTLDGQGCVKYVSPAIERVTGFEPEEIVGQHVLSFSPRDEKSRRQAEAVLHPLLRGETVERKAARSLRKDGSYGIIEFSASPVIENGEVVAVQGIFRDVTEREQAAERLRALTSQLSLAEERERRRIATELHDQVGQTMAMANLKLGVLRDETDSEELRDRLDEIRSHWQTAMAYTRSLTAELSPPVLYELGFEAALNWLVEQQQSLSETLEIDFETDGPPEPPTEELRVTLFQAVRELLVNIVKHAGARRAKVALSATGSGLSLVVEDDGAGFDSQKRKPDVEFGLFSIGQRLEALGGSMEVDSAPNRGTRVKLFAPLST